MDLTADQIEELENETVLLCQEMIRIPSVNYGEGKGDEKAISYLFSENGDRHEWSDSGLCGVV